MEYLECYNPKACCGNDCYLLDAYDNQACWGDVEVVAEEYTDDDHWWIHACQGHKDKYDGGEYILKDN